MATNTGPRIITSDMSFLVDADNTKSYSAEYIPLATNTANWTTNNVGGFWVLNTLEIPGNVTTSVTAGVNVTATYYDQFSTNYTITFKALFVSYFPVGDYTTITPDWADYGFQPAIGTINIIISNQSAWISVNKPWKDIAGIYGTLSMTGENFGTGTGGVLHFNGALGGSASTANVFVQSEEMTWDIWFNRRSSINGFNMLFSNSVPYLAFRSTGFFYFLWYTKLAGSSTNRTLSSPLTYTDGIWYNVVCTLIQDTIATKSIAKMYVNGAHVATQETAPGTLDSVFQSGRLRLANYSSPPYPFNGDISILKVYDRVLTGVEIMRNFESSRTRYGV